MLPDNLVFSEIVKTIFGDIKQYETDVPQDFKRPCFLFINPDKSTRTEELTKTLYKQRKTYEIYGFCTEDDIDSLTIKKERFLDFLMTEKKIPLPDTERFFTIESVSADTNDVESMIAFMIEVSEIKSRNFLRKSVPKINKVISTVKIE